MNQVWTYCINMETEKNKAHVEDFLKGYLYYRIIYYILLVS